MRLGNEFLHRVLTAQGIPHEYRLVPDEGHFPVAPERFLATFAFIGRAPRTRGWGFAGRPVRATLVVARAERVCWARDGTPAPIVLRTHAD